MAKMNSAMTIVDIAIAIIGRITAPKSSKTALRNGGLTLRDSLFTEIDSTIAVTGSQKKGNEQ